MPPRRSRPRSLDETDPIPPPQTLTGSNYCKNCGNVTYAPICGRCGEALTGSIGEGMGDIVIRGFVNMKRD